VNFATGGSTAADSAPFIHQAPACFSLERVDVFEPAWAAGDALGPKLLKPIALVMH
jgi:hypothetical protein